MNIDNLFEIPKLGFGLMRLPKRPDGHIDCEVASRMVDTCMSNGFYYFDTAYVYDGGESEEVAKEILVDRYPREDFTIATKLPSFIMKTKEDREQIFNTSMERTGAGYFDFYLLHAISKDSLPIFEELDCFNFIKEKKEAGLIRHIGFSFHDTPELLDEVLTKHPEMEFVQLQINYVDWEAPNVQSRGIYEVARKHNKPIIIMEPIKGGSLADLREDIGKPMKDYAPDASYASWALRYDASLEGLAVILSGMSNEEQMNDNVATMKNFKPLSEEERQVIQQVKDEMAKIPSVACTECKYCVKGCPEHITIPSMIRLLNNTNIYGYTSSVARSFKLDLGMGSGKPSACVECGQCEEICPQHLPIINALKEAVEKVEKPTLG